MCVCIFFIKCAMRAGERINVIYIYIYYAVVNIINDELRETSQFLWFYIAHINKRDFVLQSTHHRIDELPKIRYRRDCFECIYPIYKYKFAVHTIEYIKLYFILLYTDYVWLAVAERDFLYIVNLRQLSAIQIKFHAEELKDFFFLYRLLIPRR